MNLLAMATEGSCSQKGVDYLESKSVHALNIDVGSNDVLSAALSIFVN